MKKKTIIIITLIISTAVLYYIKIKSSTPMQTQEANQQNFHNTLNNEDQKNFDQLQKNGIIDESVRAVENGAKNITNLLNGFSNTAKNLISAYLAYLGFKNIETGEKNIEKENHHENFNNNSNNHHSKNPEDHNEIIFTD